MRFVDCNKVLLITINRAINDTKTKPTVTHTHTQTHFSWLSVYSNRIFCEGSLIMKVSSGVCSILVGMLAHLLELQNTFSPLTPQIPGVVGFHVVAREAQDLFMFSGLSYETIHHRVLSADWGAGGKTGSIKGKGLIPSVGCMNVVQGAQNLDNVVWRVLTPTPCKNNQSLVGDRKPLSHKPPVLRDLPLAHRRQRGSTPSSERML